MSVNSSEGSFKVMNGVNVNGTNMNETSSISTFPKKTKDRRFWKKWCQYGCKAWCFKYFWEGQLERGAPNIVEGSHIHKLKFTPTVRKLVAVISPAVVFHFLWWSVMIKHNLVYLFVDKYPMTITMVFAAMIAGMTSKGGGAVAFPIMTLVMGVSPSVARDFAVMIQSFGMGSATFGILFMRVHLEFVALILCFLGGIAGLIIGIEVIDQYLTPPVKKMGFVSIWFSFTFALFLLNRTHTKRKTFNNIINLKWWKYILLLFVGFIGGIMTSFAGSGVDICCYSILTLFFRVSEKVATPTSVILMALISMVGFFWRGLILQAIIQESWEFLLVCIPIVVFAAPLGSLLGTHFHRLVLASFVHIIDIAALIGAFAVVPQTPALTGGSCAVIVLGALFFWVITKLGQRMLTQYENDKAIVSMQNVKYNQETRNGQLENGKIKMDSIEKDDSLQEENVNVKNVHNNVVVTIF